MVFNKSIMILNNYFLILTVIFIKNTSSSFDLTDIYNMDRINNFIFTLNIKSFIDYNSENNKLNETEVNKEFKKILIDLTSVLKNLNLIASASEDNYWPNDFYRFIKTVGDHQVKIGYTESFLDVTTHIKLIERKRSSIDAIVRSLMYFRDHNYFDDFLHFCPYFMGFLDFIQHDHYDQSISSAYEDFLRALRTKMASEDRHNFCGKTSSFHVGLFNFFRLSMTPFLKKYTMVRFAQIAETRCHNRSILSEPPGEFEGNFANALRLTKELLKDVKHYTYRCDGKYINEYNKGFYYYELEKMIQTIIIEERLLTIEESCSHNCDLSQVTGLINRTECRDFQECQYISLGYNICKSDETSSRRYEWFVDHNGEEFGDNNHQHCIGKLISLSSYYSPLRIRNCDFCVCTCFTNPERKYQQLNVISLRDQISDINENKVVVGVRFAKKDNVIHVQIKEGKGNPNGLITDSEWKELETFHKLYEPLRYIFKVNATSLRTLKLGVDYAKPESINCDDLIAPEGFAVTGVSFRVVEDTNSNLQLKTARIHLQIRVTPFDYISGKLIDLDQTHWIFGDSEVLREKLMLYNPDVSWKSPSNLIDSKTDQYIKFQASDLKKDAGQSTVPLFDAQNVEGEPEFPLGGVGIIHRGRKGFGGFLAFRIYDFDLSKYFKVQSRF